MTYIDDEVISDEPPSRKSNFFNDNHLIFHGYLSYMDSSFVKNNRAGE